MKNIVISNFPVGPRFNGGSMTVWGILKALNDKKEKTVLLLICDKKIKYSNLYFNCINELKKQKIDFKIVFFNQIKKNIFFKILDLLISLIFKKPHYFFYNQYCLKSTLKKILNKINVRRIFCYHFDALSACYELTGYKLYACLGDLMHEPRYYRNQILGGLPIKIFFQNKIEKYISIILTKKMTKNTFFCGFYAHHYSKVMKKILTKSKYIRTSIVQPKKKILFLKSNIKKFVLIGDLTGTVSLSNMIFLKKFLEKFHSKIPQDLTFHFYGDGNLDNEIKKFKKRVFHHGVTNNVTNVLNNDSCLLVCNEINLGIRVRIITALSHGTLVLSHISNCSGIPELKDGYNCIIFRDLNHLYRKIHNLNLKKDKILQLKRNARKTFFKYFHYKSAFKDLIIKSN